MRGTGSDAPAVATFAVGKNPTVATVLCCVPGLGQFYNGDKKKGWLMLGVGVIGLPTGVITFGAVVWSAIDAYQVASGKKPLWT